MNHVNRIYTLMLSVLLIFTVLTYAQMILLRPRFAAVPRGLGVLKFLQVTHGIYVVAIVLTLILRSATPRVGRIATAALNIALLAMIPLGTVVAVFGLLKVDKDESEI
jgi:hypothetical protein